MGGDNESREFNDETIIVTRACLDEGNGKGFFMSGEGKHRAPLDVRNKLLLHNLSGKKTSFRTAR